MTSIFWIQHQNGYTFSFHFIHYVIWDALRGLVLFLQFKKSENTHGGQLLLVKLEPSIWKLKSDKNLYVILL